MPAAVVPDASAVTNHADVSGYNKYYGWYEGSNDDLGRVGRTPAHGRSVAQLRAFGVRRRRQHHPARAQSQRTEPGRSVPPGGVPGAAARGVLEAGEARGRTSGARSSGTCSTSPPTSATRAASLASTTRAWSPATGRRARTPSTGTRPTGHRRRPCTSPAGAGLSAPLPRPRSRCTPTPPGHAHPQRRVARERSSSDRIFKWTGVTLRSGQNTVTVTATIDGTTYTDTATWTLS